MQKKITNIEYVSVESISDQYTQGNQIQYDGIKEYYTMISTSLSNIKSSSNLYKIIFMDYIYQAIINCRVDLLQNILNLINISKNRNKMWKYEILQSEITNLLSKIKEFQQSPIQKPFNEHKNWISKCIESLNIIVSKQSPQPNLMFDCLLLLIDHFLNKYNNLLINCQSSSCSTHLPNIIQSAREGINFACRTELEWLSIFFNSVITIHGICEKSESNQIEYAILNFPLKNPDFHIKIVQIQDQNDFRLGFSINPDYIQDLCIDSALNKIRIQQMQNTLQQQIEKIKQDNQIQQAEFKNQIQDLLKSQQNQKQISDEIERYFQTKIITQIRKDLYDKIEKNMEPLTQKIQLLVQNQIQDQVKKQQDQSSDQTIAIKKSQSNAHKNEQNDTVIAGGYVTSQQQHDIQPNQQYLNPQQLSQQYLNPQQPSQQYLNPQQPNYQQPNQQPQNFQQPSFQQSNYQQTIQIQSKPIEQNPLQQNLGQQNSPQYNQGQNSGFPKSTCTYPLQNLQANQSPSQAQFDQSQQGNHGGIQAPMGYVNQQQYQMPGNQQQVNNNQNQFQQSNLIQQPNRFEEQKSTNQQNSTIPQQQQQQNQFQPKKENQIIGGDFQNNNISPQQNQFQQIQQPNQLPQMMQVNQISMQNQGQGYGNNDQQRLNNNNNNQPQTDYRPQSKLYDLKIPQPGNIQNKNQVPQQKSAQEEYNEKKNECQISFCPNPKCDGYIYLVKDIIDFQDEYKCEKCNKVYFLCCNVLLEVVAQHGTSIHRSDCKKHKQNKNDIKEGKKCPICETQQVKCTQQNETYAEFKKRKMLGIGIQQE